MADPYRILGVGPESTDDDIRQAYLKRVKAHPPERHPDRFERVRGAYEKLRDARSRLAFLLFEPARGETMEDVIEEVRCRSRKKLTLERIRQLFTGE